MARMLKDAGGIPAYGNSTREWDPDDAGGQPQPGVPLTANSALGRDRGCAGPSDRESELVRLARRFAMECEVPDAPG